MKKSFFIALLLILGTIFLVQASTPPRAEAGVFTNILFYIPNRVFDVLDIVRLRLRVGPGISLGVRATKPLTAFIGPHMTVWAGLPGPRGKPWLPLPFGFEARSGAQLSVIDLAKSGAYYGPLEIGLEFQFFLIGPNVGVDPYELVDCLLGFFMIDIQKDDFGRGYGKDKEEATEPEVVSEKEEAIETEEVIELE